MLAKDHWNSIPKKSDKLIAEEYKKLVNAEHAEKQKSFVNKVILDLYCAYDMPLDEFS